MIKKFKKLLAGILAAALVFSMAPVTESTVEAADLPEVTAHYDMSHHGDQLLDVSGNHRDAKLYDTANSDFKSSGNTNSYNFSQYTDGKTNLPNMQSIGILCAKKGYDY